MSNSMSFNGVRKPFVKVLERGRPYWAPRNTEIVTRGRRHRVKKVDKEPIPLPVTLSIEGNSKSDLLDKAEEVAAWLNTDKEAPLIFDDRTNRTHWALLDGSVDEEEIVSFSTASLEFISLFKTGKSKSINLITTNQTFLITGQIETPWTSRTVFTKSASQFTIIGPFDKNITLNYNFIAGDVLEIDYKSRDVFLNGNDLATSISLLTNWFEIPVGYITLRASQPTEITYTERYL